MTDQDVLEELVKNDDHMWLSVVGIWLRRNLPESIVGTDGNAVDNLPGIVARRLYRLACGRDFYRIRCHEFDKLARTLPEPYASQALAIRQNGKIAPWNEAKEQQS